MNILGVCGSLKASSSNLTLLQDAQTLLSPTHTLTIFKALGALPLFNPDISQPPEPVVQWRSAILASDAVLFACPEYGHSLPGALKNAIDWVIGSGEFCDKPVLITASVPHESRGLRGLQALAQTLNAIDTVMIWNHPTVRGDDYNDHLVKMTSHLNTIHTS